MISFLFFFLIEANTRERMMNDDVFFQSGESNLYIILFNNVQKNDTQQLNHKYTGAKYLLNDDVHSFTGRCYFQPIFFMFFFFDIFEKQQTMHADTHKTHHMFKQNRPIFGAYYSSYTSQNIP